MKKVFADANLFLRFFTQDDEGQHQKAAALFRQASEGHLSVITGPPVLFEVAWTLSSTYHQPRLKVLEVLEALLSLQGLKLTDEDIVSDALELARTSGQEFADAYIAVSARYSGADSVATFNRKHFERLGMELHSF